MLSFSRVCFVLGAAVVLLLSAGSAKGKSNYNTCRTCGVLPPAFDRNNSNDTVKRTKRSLEVGYNPDGAEPLNLSVKVRLNVNGKDVPVDGARNQSNEEQHQRNGSPGPSQKQRHHGKPMWPAAAEQFQYDSSAYEEQPQEHMKQPPQKQLQKQLRQLPGQQQQLKRQDGKDQSAESAGSTGDNNGYIGKQGAGSTESSNHQTSSSSGGLDEDSDQLSSSKEYEESSYESENPGDGNKNQVKEKQEEEQEEDKEEDENEEEQKENKEEEENEEEQEESKEEQEENKEEEENEEEQKENKEEEENEEGEEENEEEQEENEEEEEENEGEQVDNKEKQKENKEEDENEEEEEENEEGPEENKEEQDKENGEVNQDEENGEENQEESLEKEESKGENEEDIKEKEDKVDGAEQKEKQGYMKKKEKKKKEVKEKEENHAEEDEESKEETREENEGDQADRKEKGKEDGNREHGGKTTIVKPNNNNANIGTEAPPSGEDLWVPWELFLWNPNWKEEDASKQQQQQQHQQLHPCPAVIINLKFLLTSQACLRRNKSEDSDGKGLVIHKRRPKLGESPLPEPDLKVLHVTHHRGFKVLAHGGAVHDVSLVKVDGLGSCVEQGKCVPLCLPSLKVRKKQQLVGDEFVQFYQVCPGNGSSPEKADDAALLPQMEKATVMSMHDTKECQDLLEGDHPSRYHICTMNLQPKSALCFGKDNASGGLYSGGQLAAFDPASNRYSLVGIYSFGQERCTSNEATVFTRVDKYLKWIVTKIQEGECRGGGGGGTLDKKKDS